MIDRPARRRNPASVLLAAVLLGGCQTYEPAPLNLVAHRAEFRARLDGEEALRTFADRLRDTETVAPLEFDLADGLSVEEGEVVALFFNAELRMARLETDAALATWETAGLWDDPVFGFGGAEILNSSSTFEYGLQLDLTIPISGRLDVEKDRAEAAYDAARQQVVADEWATRMRVRRRWIEWSALQAKVAQTKQLLARLDPLVTMVDELESGGELGRTSARLFAIERSSRADELRRLETELETARIDLHAELGLAADAPVPLLIRLAAPPPPLAADLDDALIRRNPTLLQKRLAYREAEDALRLEIRRQYPDLVIGGGYGSEDDDRLLLGLSVALPIFNANRAGIAEAEAGREIARADAEIAYERLSTAMARARVTLDGARYRRTQIEDVLIPLVTAQAGDVERLAELGEVDTFLLLETIKRSHRIKLDLVDVQVEESLGAIAIDDLIGPAGDSVGDDS